MRESVFTIRRQGDQWSVSSEGTVLALSRTKKGATELAKAADGMLRDSSPAEPRVAPERRSFSKD
jgi:hypothetical protein